MKVLFFDNGLPYDLDTPYNQPSGGSETSFLLLAKGLSQLNHNVVLLNTITYKEQQKNLIIDNNTNFIDYANQADIILFNRSIPPEAMNYINKKLFYLAHDAYDQQNIRWMMNNKAEHNLNKIICVSNWQKESFINYLLVDPNSLTTLGNPIDYRLYQGYTKRDPNKLVFASIPFKGLEILPDLFNDIKLKSKNKDLHLDIYSSFALYNRQEENETYADIYRKLSNDKDINIYNPVSMKDLAYVFKSAGLYIAPSTYHETFGRVFVESMASGCLPVTVNNGANKEVIGNNGYVLDGANIYNRKCYNDYVDLVCDLLKKNLYSKRVVAERDMIQWDYMKLAKRLEKIFLMEN